MTHSCPPRRSSDLGVHIGVGFTEVHTRDQGARRVDRVGDRIAWFDEHGTAAADAAHDLNAVSLCCFGINRSEEHTSELQSLMRISYAVFCLTKNKYILHCLYHTQTPYYSPQ